ncbi:MAG TPA: DUF2167 domain-containing protein [Polyangiaceae bacterium]|nr:DUF2167 domain-containing protein [Polyangiaceae bacterium]
MGSWVYRLLGWSLLISLCLVAGGRGVAQADEPAPAASGEQWGADAAEGDQGPHFQPVRGPKRVALGHELSLDLPEGFFFLEKKDADEMMRRSGNQDDPSLLGVVLKPEESWLVTISFDAEGYIKDEDGEKLDADEILEAISEGTEQANKYRAEHGFKPMHVDGWSEPPRYDRKTHQLIWGVIGSDADGKSINYNTRVLGRHGYASLNLIDAPEKLAQSKQEAAILLGATHFDAGARYEDFNEKSDKVAEYGLAALVAGGAGAAALKLAKVGLLAKFGGKLIALLIAGKKVLIAALIALAAWAKRYFGNKKTPKAEPTSGES